MDWVIKGLDPPESTLKVGPQLRESGQYTKLVVNTTKHPLATVPFSFILLFPGLQRSFPVHFQNQLAQKIRECLYFFIIDNY